VTRSVHVVLPNDIDDPATPSGGNAYDRRVCDGLAAAGWTVREHAVRGAWPRPSDADRAALARVLADLPSGAVVLVDGLIASAVPDVLAPATTRLRVVVLMHMPLGDATERAALAAAAAVVTTSHWSRTRLVDLGLPAERVYAAPPGVDAAPRHEPGDTGGALLCVAAVTPHKGHDVLVEALAAIRDRSWTCVCVGALDRDPAFADAVRRTARTRGIADRVAFVGPRTGADLDARYAAADLLVQPSRRESYGMVVTEALARGVPVVASSADGLPESLGRVTDGLPGMLVPPGDPAALAAALRRWLAEPDLRDRIRKNALVRRKTLTGWAATTKLVADALSTVATHESAGR
jgi:glycosyltransferase involved in cell wall biosynthesis